jgi:hypothetical protein
MRDGRLCVEWCLLESVSCLCVGGSERSFKWGAKEGERSGMDKNNSQQLPSHLNPPLLLLTNLQLIPTPRPSHLPTKQPRCLR